MLYFSLFAHVTRSILHVPVTRKFVLKLPAHGGTKACYLFAKFDDTKFL